MASRFASNLIVLLAGALLACLALTLPLEVVGWVGLGTGALVLAVTLAAFAVHGRGTMQRVLDAALLLLAAWTIVASLTFTLGPALEWLMFSSGVALVLLAVEGLIAHEIVLELSLRREAEGHGQAAGRDSVDQAPSIRVAG
jgi:hypothetical protein